MAGTDSSKNKVTTVDLQQIPISVDLRLPYAQLCVAAMVGGDNRSTAGLLGESATLDQKSQSSIVPKQNTF